MRPAWLKKKIDLKACSAMKPLLRELNVETVCEQAMCPNIGECFSRKEATFLILGRHCTRQCSFCNVDRGTPAVVDQDEPARVAAAVARLGLKHAVVTSVTRDDLADGGAQAFAATVAAVRATSPATKVEVLIPDLKCQEHAVRIVADSRPDIIAHNVETVPSLYLQVRQGAEYLRSLDVLRMVKRLNPGLHTKSGIMVGMGEREDEVRAVMADLRQASCDFLSIGQYLAPSSRHFPVKEYVAPEQFDRYKAHALAMGFLHVASGAYVRSSYQAGEYL